MKGRCVGAPTRFDQTIMTLASCLTAPMRIRPEQMAARKRPSLNQ
jgi:hypothetical protein